MKQTQNALTFPILTEADGVATIFPVCPDLGQALPVKLIAPSLPVLSQELSRIICNRSGATTADIQYGGKDTLVATWSMEAIDSQDAAKLFQFRICAHNNTEFIEASEVIEDGVTLHVIKHGIEVAKFYGFNYWIKMEAQP